MSKLLSRFRHQFQEIHWPKWSNRIRKRVLECVENIVYCWSKSLWFATHQCPGCQKVHNQCFTCKRPICSSCSKPRCDKLINGMCKRLPTNIKYIHLTFSLPEELRDFWLMYRKFWVLNILFNQVHAIVLDFFTERFWCKPWIFSVIHTFWSAVNRNPHIHCVITLWWIKEDDDWNFSRLDIDWAYISYKYFKKVRRACIVKECRDCLRTNDPSRYDYRNNIFQPLFRKSRYVKVSDPIFHVVYVMSYMTRYMYRPPVSLSNITAFSDTWDPHTSSITVRYFHKNPREERFATYSLFEFMGILAMQVPDKYFRTVRYGWIFVPQVRKKYIPILESCTRDTHRHAKKLSQRPTSFPERIQTTFWYNPLHCTDCNLSLELVSITYFSKKTNAFVTKYFNSS